MPEEVAVALLDVNASVSPHKLFDCCISLLFCFVCLFVFKEKLNCSVSWNVYLALLSSKISEPS